MKRMARAAFVAAALCLAASASGCVCARERAFHDAVEQLGVKSGMLDEYKKFVEKSDLKPETKKIRSETADRLRAVIEEEGRALK